VHQRDWANRIAFAQNVLEIVADDMAIGMGDEAHFHLSGCVNKQNFHYWMDANLQQLHECPLHSEHVTVWCCVGSFGVTVPHFFEDGHAVTVNSGRCVHMLHNFLAPEIKDAELINQPCGFNCSYCESFHYSCVRNVSWPCHFSTWSSSMACLVT
jgi:hypothetical protein